MGVFRRRRPTPDERDAAEAFRRVLDRVECAVAVLTQAAPTTRFEGRPLAEVLVEYEAFVRAAQADMPGWRLGSLEREWVSADDGLRRALATAERLRVEAPRIRGFESIIGTIDGLIEPLEAFEAAAERVRDLGRRSGRRST